MKISSSKKRVAAIGLVTAATLVGGGVAFAYWTNGGAGTGTATTGTTSDNLIVTASGPIGLVPGGGTQPLALSVTNPNSYSVQLTGQSVSIVADSITCDLTLVPDAWFSLGSSTITSTTVVGAGLTASLTPSSGVSLQMNDDLLLNQNVCKGADIEFDLEVS